MSSTPESLTLLYVNNKAADHDEMPHYALCVMSPGFSQFAEASSLGKERAKKS